MSSEQVENAKNSAADAAEQTKEVGADKTGAAQEQAQGLGQTVQDKAGDAQQGAADAAQAAKDKAASAKDQSGNALQQAGNKFTETFNNVKDAVTGNK
ncbi:unnamed protein product [Calypogeia fissa]